VINGEATHTNIMKVIPEMRRYLRFLFIPIIGI